MTGEACIVGRADILRDMTHQTIGSRVSSGADWMFRSRESGKLAIAQLPNLPLTLFLVLRLAQAVSSPRGTTESVLHWAGTAALVWWAVDELARGVSPFRRLLGGGVLAWLVVSAFLR